MRGLNDVKRKQKTYVTLALFVILTTLSTQMIFANDVAQSIQDAMSGGGGGGFDNVTQFFTQILSHVSGLVPIVGALALVAGFVISFVVAPFKNQRQLGIGCIVFSILMFALWIFMPYILNILTENTG